MQKKSNHTSSAPEKVDDICLCPLEGVIETISKNGLCKS
jgi:hypothetical protein